MNTLRTQGLGFDVRLEIKWTAFRKKNTKIVEYLQFGRYCESVSTSCGLATFKDRGVEKFNAID